MNQTVVTALTSSCNIPCCVTMEMDVHYAIRNLYIVMRVLEQIRLGNERKQRGIENNQNMERAKMGKYSRR